MHPLQELKLTEDSLIGLPSQPIDAFLVTEEHKKNIKKSLGMRKGYLAHQGPSLSPLLGGTHLDAQNPFYMFPVF